MSYLHIDNLYKDPTILDFMECYAMEKIHGTSAHVRFKREIITHDYLDPVSRTILTFFSGGEKHETFKALFDEEILTKRFSQIFPEGAVDVTVYGEAYGGKCQGMSKTYGKDLRFVAFEVRVGDSWLNVPMAEQLVRELGLEFVHYRRIPATMVSIDHERDLDSVQAVRNGMGPGLMREGVVLRPLVELVRNNGARVIAKHKRPEFCETASKREVNPDKRQLLEDADAIAQEWVTKERLNHVLDAIRSESSPVIPIFSIQQTGLVIKAMIEDVVREAGAEIMDTKEARRAIGARAAKLYKIFLSEDLRGPACPNALGEPGPQGPIGAKED